MRLPRLAAFVALLVSMNVHAAGAAELPLIDGLYQRPEGQPIELVGGPTCEALNASTGEHRCHDPFRGSLGGRWLMFHRDDRVTIRGQGYFLMRWELAWFNRPGGLVMPSFTDQTGTLKLVVNADVKADQVGLDARTWYGSSMIGTMTDQGGAPVPAWQWVPDGTPMMWRNQYFYLDGEVTIQNNERGADYNISITPKTFDEVLADYRFPARFWSFKARRAVSLDPARATAVPARPTSFMTTVSGTGVRLTWDPVPGATGYEVQYSNGVRRPDTGQFLYKPVDVVPAGVTNVFVGRLLAGERYRFRVTAFNALGDSNVSQAAGATIPRPGPLPNGWRGVDIGIDPSAEMTSDSFGVAGTSGYRNGMFRVGGSGSDIWNTADHFRFVYRTLDGDGSITAQVRDQTYVDGWSKAGVMMRESLEPGARHVSVFSVPWSFRAHSQGRTSTDGPSSTFEASVQTKRPAPIWLRVTRAGDTFKAFSSVNGRDWSEIRTWTATMPSRIYVGLAVTAHTRYSAGDFATPLTGSTGPYNDWDKLNTATFSNVTVKSGT